MDEITAPVPLRLAITQTARADITSALLYLDGFGDAVSQRFTERLEEELNALQQSIAEEIVEQGRPAALLNEEASAYHARPVYRHSFRTGKSRSRRSSAGLWYIFYCLIDAGEEGRPKTLQVMRIRHSAAAPLTVETRTASDDEIED